MDFISVGPSLTSKTGIKKLGETRRRLYIFPPV
uniref:Uncharacterized protein n=1 Tax=Anguilla anguilla TaxID=7936 RepID=A0A0E9SAX6_ANGAN